MGVAYAVWSGMGTVAAVAVGILYFDEPSSLIKLGCVALIAIGLIGLNVSS
jgi:quaternary ammonium compound-resistance protein SugE